MFMHCLETILKLLIHCSIKPEQENLQMVCLDASYGVFFGVM
jgi:hypothetical protein